MNKVNSTRVLVSIITPVYNSENFVADTIESVLKQSYENWELLLVDDCSYDGSFKIINKYAKEDSRIKVFSNIVNSKAFESRNVALRNAKGRYIAFLDSDDLWHSNKLKLQIEFMQKNNYPFTYTAFSRFINNPLSNKPVFLKNKVSYKSLLSNSIIATSSVMIDKKYIAYFEMENVYYDDFKLWLEILKKQDFAYCLNSCLLYYRISKDSLSNNKFKSAKRVYKIVTKNLGLNIFKSHFYYIKWVVNAILRHFFKY